MIPHRHEPFYGMEPPHDYHDPAMEMHYFGTPPLPPFPIVSTVGKGPKGDGIVMRVKVDPETGREYIEFWSTDPDVPGPLWVSPLFPKRDEDDPHGGDDPDIPTTPKGIAKRLAATRDAMMFVQGMYNDWTYKRATLRSAFYFQFPWNRKFLEPFIKFNINSRAGLLVRIPSGWRGEFMTRGSARQVWNPDSEANGRAMNTPGAITSGTGYSQADLIDAYMAANYPNGRQGCHPTPREIAKVCGVIVPWEYPDGYTMYPLQKKESEITTWPKDRFVGKGIQYVLRYSYGLYPSVYATNTTPLFIPTDDTETVDGVTKYLLNNKYIGIPGFSPSARVFTMPNPRRYGLIYRRYCYYQKDYYWIPSTVKTAMDAVEWDPDASDADNIAARKAAWNAISESERNKCTTVTLPFGMSGGTVYSGDANIYSYPFLSSSSDFVAEHEKDRRIIDFSQYGNNATWRGYPTSTSRKCSPEVAKKAACVMIELAAGNGRGLWYSNEHSGEPYPDPMYHDRVLDPEQWRVEYNKWYDESDETKTYVPSMNPRYYTANDREIDWEPEPNIADISPLFRGAFFYKNGYETRMFPNLRARHPEFSDQQWVEYCMDRKTKENDEVRYVSSVGADCSSTVALCYFAPVGITGDDKNGYVTDPSKKSWENVFWMPNGTGGSVSNAKLVAAAPPGVPLYTKMLKPGDVIGLQYLYSSNDGSFLPAPGAINHVALVVSTPDCRMFKKADVDAGKYHYPVYDHPNWDDPEYIVIPEAKDRCIKYFKKLTWQDVCTKVIAMHTSGSASLEFADTAYDAEEATSWFEMYKADNGNWYFKAEGTHDKIDSETRLPVYEDGKKVQIANNPSQPVMNPFIISNNDLEHWQMMRGFRWVVRWAWEDNAADSTNQKSQEQYATLYQWMSELIPLIEDGKVNLYPDEEYVRKLAEFDKLENIEDGSVVDDDDDNTPATSSDDLTDLNSPIADTDDTLTTLNIIRPGLLGTMVEPMGLLGNDGEGYEEDDWV